MAFFDIRASRRRLACDRLDGYAYHRCALASGHDGGCVSTAIGEPPRVRRPDPATLQRRRLQVWEVADALHERQVAHAAWGDLGINERLRLGSKILDLVRRCRGNDGGRLFGTEIP